MSLTQASAKLLKTLEKYSTAVKQEKLILPKEEISAKQKIAAEIMHQIHQNLQVNEKEALKKIEQILDEIHKTCMEDKKKQVISILEQKTVLLFHKDKKFVLSKNIPRPQIDFKDRENKYSLTAKSDPPKEHIPLSVEQIYFLYNNSQSLFTHQKISAQVNQHQHPHQHQYPSIQLITTPEEMDQANEEILNNQIVGIDIKKHSFRSYKGFICYISVCTKDKIYIIDLLKLRNISNCFSFLSSDKIFKIMYKMPEKRYWIEKDLKYTLNTCVDLSSLSNMVIPSLSLQKMIKTYLSLPVKKEFHLLDWRYRPMTQEIFQQLINDVKYLLPLISQFSHTLSFEQFKNTFLCPVEYVTEPATPEYFAEKYGIDLSPQLKEVFSLRLFIARQEDESPQFILTDRQLCILLKNLPSSPNEVFSLFPKTSSLFKANLNNFLRVLHPTKDKYSFSMHSLKQSE